MKKTVEVGLDYRARKLAGLSLQCGQRCWPSLYCWSSLTSSITPTYRGGGGRRRGGTCFYPGPQDIEDWGFSKKTELSMMLMMLLQTHTPVTSFCCCSPVKSTDIPGSVCLTIKHDHTPLDPWKTAVDITTANHILLKCDKTHAACL